MLLDCTPSFSSCCAHCIHVCIGTCCDCVDEGCAAQFVLLCSYAIKKKDEIERVAKANR